MYSYHGVLTLDDFAAAGTREPSRRPVLLPSQIRPEARAGRFSKATVLCPIAQIGADFQALIFINKCINVLGCDADFVEMDDPIFNVIAMDKEGQSVIFEFLLTAPV